MKIIEGLFLILVGVSLIYLCLPYADRLRELMCKGDHKPYLELVFKSFRDDPADNNSMPATQDIAECIMGASRSYQIPTNVLTGIMYVEGGHVGQEVGPNFNGTYDLGLMQVNSLWAPRLAHLWNVDSQTAYNWVRDSGCVNIYVGAWILKQRIVETGTLHEGIAHYHSSKPDRGAVYANKVVTVIEQKGLSFPP
jgi:soluble lytic murein transglycosylase-like protein